MVTPAKLCCFGESRTLTVSDADGELRLGTNDAT